ncbi:MAG: ABC transporter substrate-binding protein [Eubacteriales bacterium]|nr:ABC transporter substrate-binding protein [Eubacteriales bacterium]
MKRKNFTRRMLTMTLCAAMSVGMVLPAMAEENADAFEGIDTSKHEVINMLVLGNKPTNGRLEAMLEKLNEVLTEKVNAELELTYIEWTDWQTQYNVQLLSGDSSMDIITTATDWLFGWENAQKGAFLPLSEDMLQTYAPKTWAQVDEAGDWDICKLDDEIYFIPEDHYTQYVNHGLFYRGDWAAEAGLENGDVKSFEDLDTYFSYILDNKEGVIPFDATKNSGAPCHGYLVSNTDNIEFTNVYVGNYTFWFGESVDDPYTVTSPYMESDALYDAADLMKKWNDEGVWREDVLNYDGDTREAFYAGTSGSDQHHSQTYYSQVKPNMDIKQPGSDVKMYYWGEDNNNVSKPLKTHGAAAISAWSEHPERALMVYDLLRNDEECYRLINYGIEGTDYIVTEDGKLDYPEGYDSSTDALGANFWCGRNDDLELENSFNWEGTDDMIANYDSFAFEYPYEDLIVDKTSIEAEQAAMANVLAEYLPQLYWGKFDDPHAAIDEMREKLIAAGYEDVKASIQADMDAYVASKAE